MHTGSYYDKVRVNDAKEFDLNVALSLDMIEKSIVFDYKKCDQGYTRIEIPSPLNIPTTHPLVSYEAEFLKAFTQRDSNTKKIYLINYLVRSWMDGLLTKSLNSPSFQKYVEGIAKVKCFDSTFLHRCQKFAGSNDQKKKNKNKNFWLLLCLFFTSYEPKCFRGQ